MNIIDTINIKLSEVNAVGDFTDTVLIKYDSIIRDYTFHNNATIIDFVGRQGLELWRVLDSHYQDIGYLWIFYTETPGGRIETMTVKLYKQLIIIYPDLPDQPKLSFHLE